MDGSQEWYDQFCQDHPGFHMPIMEDTAEAFDAFRLGIAHRTWPPLYIVIDKRGIVRHRSLSQGSISPAAAGAPATAVVCRRSSA